MESSSQTPRLTSTIHKMIGERALTETASVMSSVKAKTPASAEMVERVRSIAVPINQLD